jgi:hypothetical protein
MKIRTTALDRLFSQYIRARAGYRCEYSGEQGELMDCAHVLSRRFVHTRWDPRNAVCLTRRWHMYFTERPHEWADWTRRYLGADTVQALQELAACNDTLTDADRIAIGEDLIRRIQELGEKPVCGLGRRLTAKKKRKSKYKRKVNGQTVIRDQRELRGARGAAMLGEEA